MERILWWGPSGLDYKIFTECSRFLKRFLLIVRAIWQKGTIPSGLQFQRKRMQESRASSGQFSWYVWEERFSHCFHKESQKTTWTPELHWNRSTEMWNLRKLGVHRTHNHHLAAATWGKKIRKGWFGSSVAKLSKRLWLSTTHFNGWTE